MPLPNLCERSERLPLAHQCRTRLGGLLTSAPPHPTECPPPAQALAGSISTAGATALAFSQAQHGQAALPRLPLAVVTGQPLAVTCESSLSWDPVGPPCPLSSVRAFSQSLLTKGYRTGRSRPRTGPGRNSPTSSSLNPGDVSLASGPESRSGLQLLSPSAHCACLWALSRSRETGPRDQA